MFWNVYIQTCIPAAVFMMAEVCEGGGVFKKKSSA
jgi:hypothetical protein